MAQAAKRLPTMREIWIWSLGLEDPLEKEIATHSSTLAWKISWIGEPCRLQSIGSQRVGHDWTISLSLSGALVVKSPPTSEGDVGEMSSVSEPTCQWRRCRRNEFNPWVWKIPWKRAWQSTPVFLPEESHGQRSLVVYNPWGHRVTHAWDDLG